MPDKNPISRKLLYGVWIGAAVILLGYYILWRWGAGEMENAVHEWVAEQRENGLSVDHGEVKRDGFPFFLRVHIDNPAIATPEGIHWETESLSLDALPYDLTRLIISPNGTQSIRTGEDEVWQYTAEDFRASIGADKKRGWVASMTIEDLNATSKYGEELALKSLVFDLAPESDNFNTITLNLASRQTSLTDDHSTFTVGSFNTALSLSDTDKLGDIEDISSWRDAGGVLTIHWMNAEINEAVFSLAGDIGLDDQNRPAGGLTATLERPAGLTDIFISSGAMSKQEAEAATAGLGLMAMSQGGKIEAPVILQNGVLIVNGIEAAELPAIN